MTLFIGDCETMDINHNILKKQNYTVLLVMVVVEKD